MKVSHSEACHLYGLSVGPKVNPDKVIRIYLPNKKMTSVKMNSGFTSIPSTLARPESFTDRGPGPHLFYEE